MAKQSNDADRQVPYDETLLIHDRETGSVKAISEMKEKEGKYVDTDAISANSPAFIRVESTNPLKNFYQNFMNFNANARERFEMYRVPVKDVPTLADAIFKLHADPKDEESRKVAQQYRVTQRQLDRIKFDKAEMPWQELRAVGVSFEQLEKEKYLDALMEGRHTPPTIPVNYQIGQAGHIHDTFSLKMFRDDKGNVNFDLLPPRAQPEFNDPKWKMEFSSEERADLMKEKTLSRLVEVENRNTGQKEWSYVTFDNETNRLVTVPKREVEVPNFLFRRPLTDEQKNELGRGSKIYIENGKQFNGLEFSGPVHYDIQRKSFISDNPRYSRPYIPEYIDKQLSADQRSALNSYQEIDGREIKGRDGQNYRGNIGMDRDTNTLYWGSRIQQQEQSQQQDQTQAQSRGRGL